MSNKKIKEFVVFLFRNLISSFNEEIGRYPSYLLFYEGQKNDTRKDVLFEYYCFM
jgi:hypothetical protein